MVRLFRKPLLTVKPDSSLCVRMYHKNADCRRCLDVCPADAISMGRPGTGVAIYEDRCAGCGLCISACRQGVFKRSGTSEKNWCEYAMTKRINDRLDISCLHNPVKNTFQTECVGNIHVIHLLYWMLSGVRVIKLYLSCHGCELSRGAECIKSQIESLNKIFAGSDKYDIKTSHSDNIEIKVIKSPLMTVKPEAVLTRRQLFSHFRKEVITGVVNTMDVFTDQSREAVDFSRKHPSERKHLSNMVFKGLAFCNGESDPNIPSGAAWIEKEKCRQCGLCVKLCPVGAISIEDGSFPRIASDECTGCGVCGKVCLHNAIGAV